MNNEGNERSALRLELVIFNLLMRGSQLITEVTRVTSHRIVHHRVALTSLTFSFTSPSPATLTEMFPFSVAFLTCMAEGSVG